MHKSTTTQQYAALRRRLIEIRGLAGMSQRELGERLGVTHTWVAKVESGERRIDLIEFQWFCDACGVSPFEEARTVLKTAEKQTRRRSLN